MSSLKPSPVKVNIPKRLALGTVQFGLPYGLVNPNGQVPMGIAFNMVQFARANDIDTIDTAIGYGDSEKVLGKIGMGDLKVVSKLPPLPASVANVHAWVLSKAKASLARLGVNHLYGLLLHRSCDLSGPRGAALYAAMEELKSEGKTRKIGVSVYSPYELDKFDGIYSFDLVQAPLNLIDRRLQNSGWLRRLKARGCEVHVRSAFLQGLLLMPRSEIPPKFAIWDSLWDRWHLWLSENGEDAVNACLYSLLSLPEIDRIVVGALDLLQLQQIVQSAQRKPAVMLPDLTCEDENLINPSNWSYLSGPRNSVT